MKSSSPASRYCGVGFILVVIVLLAGSASPQTFNEAFYNPCAPYDWRTDGYILRNTDISSQEDINQNLNCSDVYQSITVLAYNISELNFNNIETFHGSFKITQHPDGIKLRKIIARNLKSVRQDFSLSNLPQLQELEVPLFESAATVSWIGLPLLKEVPLSPKSISIPLVNNSYSLPNLLVQGTGLEKLDFFSFIENTPLADTLIAITNNANLSNVDLGPMISGPGNLIINDNDPELRIVLDNMTTAGNLTFSRLAGLEMSALANTTGNLTLSRNSFQRIELPLLNLVGASLSITSNPELEKMDFPLLSKIGFLESGDLRVLDNPALKVVAGFESFEFAFGSLDFKGNFSAIMLPIDNVERFSSKGIHIDTSDPRFNCSYWTGLVSQQWPNADSHIYSCHTPNNTSNGVGPLGGTTEEKDSLTKDVYSVLIGVSIFICIFGVALVVHFVKKRKRRQVAEEAARIQQAEGIELGASGREEVGVVRLVEDNGDRPPTYSRVPKPGEVPPCYLEVMDSNDSGNRDRDEVNAVAPICEPQESPPTLVEPARAARPWLGLRREA